MTKRLFPLQIFALLSLAVPAEKFAQQQRDVTTGKVDWPADYLLEVMRPQVQLG